MQALAKNREARPGENHISVGPGVLAISYSPQTQLHARLTPSDAEFAALVVEVHTPFAESTIVVLVAWT